MILEKAHHEVLTKQQTQASQRQAQLEKENEVSLPCIKALFPIFKLDQTCNKGLS